MSDLPTLVMTVPSAGAAIDNCMGLINNNMGFVEKEALPGPLQSYTTYVSFQLHPEDLCIFKCPTEELGLVRDRSRQEGELV